MSCTAAPDREDRKEKGGAGEWRIKRKEGREEEKDLFKANAGVG